MFCKFKTVALYLKIITTLLLTRPYGKSSIKPPGAYLIPGFINRGLIREGGLIERGGLIFKAMKKKPLCWFVKGPFTQAIFVAATQCNFCRAEVPGEVATSKSHV